MKDIITNNAVTCPFCGRRTAMSNSGSELDANGFMEMTMQFWCKCGAASNRVDFGHLSFDNKISLNTFEWVWKEKGYDNCGRDARYCGVRCCFLCDRTEGCQYYKEDNP